MGWTALILAGILEIGFTTSMKLSNGFKKIGPSLFFLVFAIGSFGFMSEALKTLPLGTVYAVWTGIGSIGTALVGMWLFREPATLLRLTILALIIVLIIGLRVIP